VRLKVLRLVLRIYLKIISIPFGAIKRKYMAESTFFYKLISIPFGAIKSAKLLYRDPTFKRFQFLLVRLKVVIEYLLVQVSNRISIPFGAIKRKTINFESNAYGTFQFLLVRLKVTIFTISPAANVNFNSFWCD